jgi:hypothetical protein
MSESGVVLMSIDNLPAQLPREATDLFGSKVFPYIPDLVRNYTAIIILLLVEMKIICVARAL